MRKSISTALSSSPKLSPVLLQQNWKTVKTSVNKKQRRSPSGTETKYASTNNKSNRTDSGAAAENDERITVVVGDSIIRNFHSIKLAKAVAGTPSSCQAISWS